MHAMKISKLSRNVLLLGWVSFLTDVASEMLYPVIPLFLVGVLGGTPALLGVIDGLAEGGGTVLRWLAGTLSDAYGRRKPFVVAGYTLSAASKPVMGLAAYAIGWPLFFVGRCADRVGKSIRTSARDALIADSTPPDVRGLAFGLHGAMDTCGAVLGPMAVLLILHLRPEFPLAWLFFVALAPGLLSALLCWASVQDIPKKAEDARQRPSIFQRYPTPLWQLMAAVAVFSLGNSADTFLLLRSKELGLTFSQVVLAYALYNVVYAAAAIPCGGLSDRIGRKPVVAVGWLVYAGVYAGFATSRAVAAPWLLLGTYGVYQAMTEGVAKAMVSDIVPQEQRAGAIGLFYTVCGIGQLIATLAVGWLWKVRVVEGRFSVALLLGALCAVAAIPLLAATPVRRDAPRQ